MQDSQLVSGAIYSLILSSPSLSRAILPQGLSNPYEVLHCDATLVLHDSEGRRATFHRKERVRFLQDGVSAIMDHAWGNGILVTNYRNSAGQLRDSFKDQGIRHLVVGLESPRARGDLLSFEVERETMEAFSRPDGCLETASDHPVRQLIRRVVFPKGRPVQRAVIEMGLESMVLPIRHLADGRTFIKTLIEPEPGVRYRVRWIW